jgi:hypothetical protein
VAVDVDVGVGVAVGVAVAVGVVVGVAVSVGEGLGVAVSVGEGVGEGVGMAEVAAVHCRMPESHGGSSSANLRVPSALLSPGNEPLTS